MSNIQELLETTRATLSLLEKATGYTIDVIPIGERVECSNPQSIAAFLKDMKELSQEQLRVLVLDNKNKLLVHRIIYQGTINAVNSVRMAEIFKPAIIANGASIILVHNHPSGSLEISIEDVMFTHNAVDAGKLLDIRVLDHIIIGEGFVSLRQLGHF